LNGSPAKFPATLPKDLFNQQIVGVILVVVVMPQPFVVAGFRDFSDPA